MGCQWIYTIKFIPYGQIERLKARLVTKGYTQTLGVDYFKLSPVAPMYSIRILLSVVTVKQWLSYQLDIKNAFFS